ncbi:aminoglycoside adenylyltransferase domain-containing protein [Stappia sp. WLB 29]|uniref:aminoglycoside adenylyltransferase domain-containing protein n=1 Tax=Stappia sp. WLB 29 TaxID=2925220 RepID=UPI0020BF02E2|nr:aminoglycoside adenylyltransferase domain-containing protein [Stappia sp. WLB 29]
MRDEVDIPEQAQAVLAILQTEADMPLAGLYLHGSAVAGGLRPHSDLDLLAVVDRPPEAPARRRLLEALLGISAPYPAPVGGPRCLELMVFDRSALARLSAAMESTFVYGEWLREAFEAGDVPQPLADPEHTLVLAQAHRQAVPIAGPTATDLLPEIGIAQVREAMRRLLPGLVEGLDGDARNVVLTLARMWWTAGTGAFLSKDEAAEKAAAAFGGSTGEVLRAARHAYLGLAGDAELGPPALLREVAGHLSREIETRL